VTAPGTRLRSTLAALAALASGSTLGACKPTEELEACNIATADCQQSIYYALLRMRGDGYDPFLGVPPIRTLTVDEYEAELRGPTPAPAAPASAAKDPAPDPAATEKPIDPWDVALRLLRLVKPSTSSGEARVQDRVNHVAAFYSSKTRTVTVIDRGGMRNDRADTLLLLHELVHAVQDDEIAGWSGASTDEDFAARAMVEGEATLYENLGSVELDGLPVKDADWDGYYGNWIDRRRDVMSSQQSPFYAIGWFVYPLGGELLTEAYVRGGNAAVRHLQSSWPARSAAFMAAHDKVPTPPAAPIGCKAGPPSDGFRTVGHDHFGALQAYGFLTVNGVDEASAWQDMVELGDDELTLFLDADARAVAVSWRLRLGDAHVASELALALGGAEDFEAQASGRDLVVRGASPIELLDAWPDDEGCD